jgi:menin
MWEEGSQTPILHIGWAKPMVHCISKFDFDIRSQVCIQAATDENYNELFGVKKSYQETTTIEGNKSPDSQNNNNNNNNNCVKSDEEEKNTSKNLSRLEALASACGTKILNPDFLLQGGDKPFTTESLEVEKTNVDDFKPDLVGDVKETMLAETNGDHAVVEEVKKEEEKPAEPTLVAAEPLEPKRPEITLFSHKMKALKELLLAEKLNTNAISLQITAQVHQVQGQVSGKKSRLSHGGTAACGESEGTTRSSKRARRD